MMATNKSKKQPPVAEVWVDTNIINMPGVGASILQMFQSIGVLCISKDQLMTNTVTWQLVHPSDTADARVESLGEVLAILSVNEFVAMVNSQVKKREGKAHGPTLTDYVRQLQQIYHEYHPSVSAYGMEKYFNDQKLAAKRKHREEVTGNKAKTSRKQLELGTEVTVTRFNVEETLIATHLETGCSCKLLDSAQDVAELLKSFTKAAVDKPNKKERLDGVFSFLEEGGSGVKADKAGAGLLKVWKLQLQQLNNLGPDMAAAIATQFPSPLALKQAYDEYPNPSEAWKVTENIVVRRGAGALETGRRVGPQISRRIHTLFTSDAPGTVIK